jgi:hypothetical protein
LIDNAWLEKRNGTVRNKKNSGILTADSHACIQFAVYKRDSLHIANFRAQSWISVIQIARVPDDFLPPFHEHDDHRVVAFATVGFQ